MTTKYNVYTWNTLHIAHELKYAFDESVVLNKYNINKDTSNESKRIKDILTELDTFMKDKNSIVFLQEVSGDLLDNLLLEDTFTTSHYTYSRVPKNATQLNNPYKNMTESLVAIYPKSLELKQDYVQSTDAGKAVQILYNDTLCLVNCHLPFSKLGQELLQQLFDKLKQQYSTHTIVIGGDMNLEYLELKDVCTKLEQKDLQLVKTNGDSIKIVKKDGKIIMKTLDYFIVSPQVKVISNKVVFEKDISDHYPVFMNIYL